MGRKSWVVVVEEALKQFPPGSVLSYEALERIIRCNTNLWQRFKIRELLRSLEAKEVLRSDTDRPGMYIMWPRAHEREE